MPNIYYVPGDAVYKVFVSCAKKYQFVSLVSLES
jgi:hypothetical protein